MTQVQMSAAQHARDQIVSLGILLDDMAGGRSGAEVHQLLLDRFDEPGHDSRLDRLELGRQQFIDVWTALRQGSALPQTAWEQVILPAVVALSGPKNHKIHLELATSHWLAARAAVEAIPGRPEDVTAALALMPAIEQAPVSSAPLAWPAQVPLRPAAEIEPALPEEKPIRRRLIWALTSLIAVGLIATGTLFLLHREEPLRRQEQPVPMTPTPGLTAVVMLPSAAPSPLPTALPTSMAQPAPVDTTLPAPSPIWSGAGKSRPPSAPVGLTALAATENTVVLTWFPPLDGGTSGTDYYRILRNGSPSGWTRQTSVTITGLLPGTTYTFTVVACNAAGQQSPPSASITVVTATAPPPPVPSPSPSDPVIDPPSPGEPSTPTPGASPDATAGPEPIVAS